MSDGHGYSRDGFGIDRDSSVKLIIKTALDEGVTDPHQIAYMLATAQHETRNFTAPEEDFGRQQGRSLHYHGGEDYFGRGYVHLTHIENYQRFDTLLGLDGQLLEHKELAEDPTTAAKILVVGMRDGEFTSRRLDQYINDQAQDYVNARRVVNGTDRADLIASYAHAWNERLPALIADVNANGVELHQVGHASGSNSLLASGMRGAQVRALQGQLARLGYPSTDNPLAVDGNFGLHTQSTLMAFQRDHQLDVDGKVGPKTQAAIEQTVKIKDTRILQADLGKLGYRGARGHVLDADGAFGPNTRFAVKAFQRDHELTVDGEVGPQTQDALDTALKAQVNQHATLLSDPANPDHALYQQALTGVQKIDADMGRASDDLSVRLAAALVPAAKANGLTRIDTVALSEDGSRAFVVQNSQPTVTVAHVQTSTAVATPVTTSSTAAQVVQPPVTRQFQSDNQNLTQPPQPTEQSTPGPAMTM